jgi:FkbM family methyltransferase
MNVFKNLFKQILYRVYPREGESNIVRVWGGPAKGVRMKIDIRLGASYLKGDYDQWIFDRVKLPAIVKPGMVAWDCGAFYGYYAAIFRKLVGPAGNVQIFEASGANYEVVSSLPRINGWDNVRVHQLAIGPDHSRIQFTRNLGGSSGPFGLSKTYDENQRIELEDVTCCGVDELIEERGIPAPDIIKFDLESAEVFALQNGERLFTGKRPMILLELHGSEALEAAGDFLEKYDYNAYSVWQLNRSDRILLHDKKSLESLNLIPHMLVCFPSGHPIPY